MEDTVYILEVGKNSFLAIFFHLRFLKLFVNARNEKNSLMHSHRIFIRRRKYLKIPPPPALHMRWIIFHHHEEIVFRTNFSRVPWESVGKETPTLSLRRRNPSLYSCNNNQRRISLRLLWKAFRCGRLWSSFCWKVWSGNYVTIVELFNDFLTQNKMETKTF